jgi:polyvinyl alcohol dehydrogenase (cytochrome)
MMIHLKSFIATLLTFSVLFCHSVIGQKMTGENGQNNEGAQIQSPSKNKTGWCTVIPSTLPNLESEQSWTSWGGDLRNLRSRSSAETGLRADDIPKLEVEWAFALPEVTLMRSQPAVAGDWLYLAGMDSVVRALHARDGCIIWETKLDSPLFSGISLSGSETGNPVLFAGDLSANVYALDPVTGKQLWRRQLSDHPQARISGTPAPHEGKVYVPVSSSEWGSIAAADPEYECCTFRGKVVALNASGEVLWEYYTGDKAPEIQGINKAGTKLWGPSGAAVWSAVTLDEKRGRLYVGTGNNYSHPSTATSSAIHAIDMQTGERAWVFQPAAGDVWVVTCNNKWSEVQGWDTANCPEDNGPDFDFGAAPLLVSVRDDRDILVAGQKSGMVYGLDPDQDGEVIWKTRGGRGGILGGIHFGMAVDESLIAVPVSDREDAESYAHNPKPGVIGIDASSGEILWSTPAMDDVCENKEGCYPAFSAPATAIPGVVLAGALDGNLQAFSTDDGKRIWTFDTARPFETVKGVTGHGGAMSAAGPVVTGDMLYVISGYGNFAGRMPGNILLAFSIK